MTLRYLRTLLATTLLLAAALTAHAQTANTWTGQADTNWNNPANWSLARVPGACHDVVIPAGVTRYPTLQGDVYIQTLELGDDAKLYTNDFDIYLEVALPFSVLAQGGVMACAPGAVLPLTARVSGGDTATYTYAWTGPAGDTLGRNAGAYPDTLTVNTPQAGVKADSANTVVLFRAGFAVNAGADYTAVVTGFSSNPARQVAMQAGVYTLTVTDPLTGCSLSDTARVGYTAGPQLTLAHATDSLSCLRDSIRLLATVSPAGTPVQWSGPGLPGITADSVYARAAGTYTATVTASGCTVTESVTIVRHVTQPVITLPATDTLPCATFLVLRPVVMPAQATLRWTGPGIAEPVTADTLVVTTAGTYLLTVTHPTSGCVDTASVRVVANPDCAPPADSSCFVFIKAVDAANKETARLPRGTGSNVWGNLTLSTEDLDSAGYWNNGAIRQWLLPDSSTVNASTLTASQVGLYTVTLTKQGLSCEADIILTGTSCHAGDTTYACNPNTTAAAVPDDPAHYLQSLTPGDTIFAGDFIAIVLQVDAGSPATGWTGLASVKIPYLGGAELSATFTDAKVNDCYELISGSRIETLFDPSGGGIADIDEIIEAVQTTIPEIKRWVKNYQGSIEDKENAKEFKKSIESQIASLANDPTYSEAEKTKLLAGLNSQLDGFNYLIENGDETCQSPLDTTINAPNGRLAGFANATDVCSALSNIYKGAKQNELTFLESIWEMLSRCQSSGWATQNNEGIIPKCLWDNSDGQPYNGDRAFIAGFVDGAYISIANLLGSAVSAAECMECFNPITTGFFSSRCNNLRTQTLDFLSFLKSLTTNSNARNATWDAILNEGKGYVDATFCVQDPVCKYNQGKLTFDIMTMFVGYAEVKGALTSGLKANGFAKVILQMNKFEDLIKSVSSAVTGFGGSIVKTATNGVADVLTSTGQKMATITTDLLSPLPAHWTTINSAQFKRFVGPVKVKDPNTGQIANEMVELVDEGSLLKFRIRVGVLNFSISTHFLSSGLAGVNVPKIGGTVPVEGALGFTPAQANQIDLVNRAVNSTTNGQRTEAIEKLATTLFHNDGFEPISLNPKHGGYKIMKYSKGNQDWGFDEIAFNPPVDLTKPLNQITVNEMIIIEAKPKNPSIKLGEINNPIGTGKVPQMDDIWINSTAQKLITNGDPLKVKLGQLILREMLADTRSQKVKKAIVAVDIPKGGVFIQKLK